MESLTIAFYWYIENQMIITYFIFIISLSASLILLKSQSEAIEKQEKIIALLEKTWWEILTSYFKHFVELKKIKETLEEVRENSRKKNLTISKIEKRALIYQNVALSMQLGDKNAKFVMFEKLKHNDLRTMIENKKKELKEIEKKKKQKIWQKV